LFHWDIAPSLWFRQVTHDVKIDEFAKLDSASGESLKGQTRHLSS
jgi:hypothetical protein